MTGVHLKLLVTGLVVGALATAIAADSVDDLVKKEMIRQHVAGLSIAVLVGNKVVKIKGYGEANLELKVPAKTDTVYEIGSITKQFTAESIMMLVEQGKIDLDEKVSKYLPGTPAIWKDVTVRNLLNHTSGIKNYTSLPEFAPQVMVDTSHDDALKLIAAQPLDFPPGTRWQYSNSNYYLLGMIVENVSGETYEAYLREHIFLPLGMNATAMNHPATVIPNRASGYQWAGGDWQNAEYISMSWPFAAGAMVSCVDDFAKWAQALYEKKLLKPESYEAMYSPAKLSSGDEAPYGFGWNLQPFRGHPRIMHNGGIPGFISSFIRWPQDDLAVVVFTNSGDCNADDIAMGISGLYISALKPLYLLEPKADPNPTFTSDVKDMVSQFAKGDSNSAKATDAMKKVLNPDTQKIFEDIATHMHGMDYLDEDEPSSSGTRMIYYRVNRDDGIQFVVVAKSSDGKVAGFVAQPVRPQAKP